MDGLILKHAQTTLLQRTRKLARLTSHEPVPSWLGNRHRLQLFTYTQADLQSWEGLLLNDNPSMKWTGRHMSGKHYNTGQSMSRTHYVTWQDRVRLGKPHTTYQHMRARSTLTGGLESSENLITDPTTHTMDPKSHDWTSHLLISLNGEGGYTREPGWMGKRIWTQWDFNTHFYEWIIPLSLAT